MVLEEDLWYLEINKEYGAFLVTMADAIHTGKTSLDEIGLSEDKLFRLYESVKPAKINSSKIEITYYKYGEVPDYSLSLEKVCEEPRGPIQAGNKELWFAEVRNRMRYKSPSLRENEFDNFDYCIFMAADSRKDAVDSAKKRLFRTPGQFYVDYYNEGCPYPSAFDLECSILQIRKVEVAGYNFHLESRKS